MKTSKQELHKGRAWFGVDVNRILAVDWSELPRDLLGHWLTLFAYAARQGDGGRIRRPDRRLMKAFPNLGITSSDLRGLLRHGLVRRVGKSLEVVGYDLEREERFAVQSEAGQKAARSRWGSAGGERDDDTGDANRNAIGSAVGTADQRKEQKSNSPQGPRGGSDAGGDDPDGFAEFWAALPLFLQQRRPDALREWLNSGLDRNQVAQQRILRSLERQRNSASWLETNRKLNLTPKMYLRKRRWEDGPAHEAERSARAAKGSARSAESAETQEAREARFRADWEADPDNAGKAYPGRANAVADVTTSLANSVATEGNAQ